MIPFLKYTFFSKGKKDTYYLFQLLKNQSLKNLIRKIKQFMHVNGFQKLQSG